LINFIISYGLTLILLLSYDNDLDKLVKELIEVSQFYLVIVGITYIFCIFTVLYVAKGVPKTS